jgi:hypothetical protein
MSRSFEIPLSVCFSVIYISCVASDMEPEGGLTEKFPHCAFILCTLPKNHVMIFV